jgi:hypothetical protein
MKQYYPDFEDLNIKPSVERLQYLVDTIPAKLRQITEPEFSFKPGSDKWSKKEIIGHLIDSAANNHQRFIRIQYEDKPVIYYDQNQWNKLTNCNSMESGSVIDFWTQYNRFLLHIIKQIPKEKLSRTGLVDAGEECTLAFYINDYVKHMEHHFIQLFGNLKI